MLSVDDYAEIRGYDCYILDAFRLIVNFMWF